MSKVKFKIILNHLRIVALLVVLMNCDAFVLYRHATLSFERCSPYDTKFELNYILIDSCTKTPCLLTIGKNAVISGSFTYAGSVTAAESKLTHRPNWLLNYVYTAATVVTNKNDFSASDRIDFEATVHVDEDLAPLTGTLNWRLYDDNDNRIACYNVPIQLTL